MIIDLKTTTKDSYRFATRSELLNKYYNDIRRYPLLSPEQEREAFEKLKELNDERDRLRQEAQLNGINHLSDISEIDRQIAETKGMVINANQRFVVSVAKKFTNGKNLPDLISEGNIGLMTAIDTFDMSKGAKFSTHAIWYIRREINRYCMELSPSIKKTNRQKTFYIKIKAVSELQQQWHRDPSPEELMDYMNSKYGCDIKDVSDIMDLRVSSIDNVPSDESQIPKTISRAQVECASRNLCEDRNDREQNGKLAERMLNALNPKEQEVIKLFFGIGTDKEYCIKEISKRIGLTAERTRQIKESCLKKMKNFAMSMKRT